MSYKVIVGDCIESLKTIESDSVNCCVTSFPYWGLRDYGNSGQIGLESTPEAYVARMVEVFREVRRVLRDDGTLWLNLGDSYASNTKGRGGPDTSSTLVGTRAEKNGQRMKAVKVNHGLKTKDLVGIPWRVAFALQSDGWYIRQDIIWHKPNPMPESVKDRCTKSHEYVFLLAKSAKYFYDMDAVKEPTKFPDGSWGKTNKLDCLQYRSFYGEGRRWEGAATRNRRSVWTISTKPYKGSHFAVMPPDLVEPCILAGCPAGGTVIDPFAGSGTTLGAAEKLGRNSIGIELNQSYADLIPARVEQIKNAKQKGKKK
jgi:site-specific DNA-methyltransferase (adenine-specific)